MTHPIYQENENNADGAIRPGAIDEFIGQKEVIANIKVYLEAALLRNEPLDHILFSGPPGLGKTTLAKIIASRQNGKFYQVSAPNLKRPGDIVKIAMTLEEKDTLFIDEIHRMPAPVEEILYPIMEDGKVDITLSEGMSAAPIELDIPPFTLVGATTKPGNLSAPLRDRFGIHFRLEYYDPEEIKQILKRASGLWEIQTTPDALTEIALRSRRTPRVALRLLRRIWDYAIVAAGKSNTPVIEAKMAIQSFEKMGIDRLGLTGIDNEFLQVMALNYKGGPVGLKPLSAILSEDILTLEDFIEPYMIQLDLVQRTPRGRILTPKGYDHLGIAPLGEKPPAQQELFYE